MCDSMGTVAVPPVSEETPENAPSEIVVATELLARRVGWVASGIWFCAGLLSIYTLYIGRNLFMPIAVALFAYLTVRPMIRACSRLGIPTGVSAAGVMIGLCCVLSTAMYLLSGPAREMLQEVPRSMKEVKVKLAFVFDHLETVNDATEDISQAADEESLSPDEKPVPVQIKPTAWTTTSPLIAGTGNAMSFFSIAGVLLYFLMAAGDALIRNLMSALPTFSSKRRFIEAVESVQDALSSYLAWVTLINACLGITIGTAMWVLGMPSPVLWGVAAMLLNFVPIVGAMVGIACVFFVALVNHEHASYAFIVAGTYATLTTLEGQFITPSILGRSMKLSSVLVFLSIVIWGWMWGMMGVFLAVPILIALTMISQKLDAMSPINAVLGGSGGRDRGKPTDDDHSLETATSM
ncbi:AI-2 transport protein TqsA [Stieleria maiorica]|uniref:AI-2 transport protein TqsA n=1 Tax=Stieleria maiorica TaxID=2795974 RepID=A0A5B9MS49_9BACT|nr:AI-2E family transporter [Stieleria maiorica]QEG02765.1 AI-2 transport protein TqsA [Stieleria maiorica]